MPVSKQPTNLYEGTDFLVVKPVHVESLPQGSTVRRILNEQIVKEP